MQQRSTEKVEIEKQAKVKPPGVSNYIERNIRTILRLRKKADEERGFDERLADSITSLSGRMIFVYVHVFWFTTWILLNNGLFGIEPFDPFPYGFLTMIVSLEAIFLSTFVLISQNRSNVEAERRAELSMHIGLLTERELTRALQMIDAIQTKLGIENNYDSELADLERDTRAEDVLAEIDRMQSKLK